MDDLGRAALTGTVLGLLLTLSLYVVATVGDGELLLASAEADRPVPAVSVVLLTLLGGLAGYGLALQARSSPQPPRAFLTFCGAGLLVSFVPAWLAAASVGTALWLSLLHVAAAAGIVGVLEWALRREAASAAAAPPASGPLGASGV